MKRWILGVLSLVVLLALLLGGWGVLQLRHEVPARSGVRTLSVLQDTVEVVFDAYAVPHIFAKTLNDLFRAQGFLHAQERWFQMDLLRRAAWGRLAEAFGDAGVATDRLVRTLGFGRLAEQALHRLSPKERAILEAYAEGVNAFLAQGPLPLECRLLGLRPEPWKPEHSLAFLVLLAFDLNTSWRGDFVYTQLRRQLPDSLFRYLVSSSPPADTALFRQFWHQVSPFLALAQKSEDWLDLGLAGSNAWAVAGSRTQDGKPILCNDPHLALRIPPVFYENGLHAPGLDLYGVSVAGVPLVIIGHTPAMAWGLTALMLDDGDYYREVLPDPLHYRHRGTLRPLEVRQETIRIKGQPPLVFQVRSTHHGPLVSDLGRGAEADTLAFAYHWYAVDPAGAFQTLVRLPQVHRFSELQEAVRPLKGPGLNVIYADTAGHIAHQAAGAVPLRPKRWYLFPLDGPSEEGAYTGFVPVEHLPHGVDPPRGFVVSANNAVVTEAYPYYVSVYWETPSRFLRLRQRLAALHHATPDSMAALQFDHHDLVALHLVQVLQAAAQRVPPSPRAQEALRFLQNWDGQVLPHLPQPTLVYTFLRLTLHRLYRPHLGDSLFALWIRTWNLPVTALLRILSHPASGWYDDPATPAKEQRDSVLLALLAAALDSVQRWWGSSPQEWAWGRVHPVVMEHAFHAKFPVFSLRAPGLPGSPFTVNKQEWKWSAPDFASRWGPATRQIVPLGDVDQARSVIPAGQSGHRFLDPHHRDQFPLWRTGATHAAPLSRGAVEAVARSRLLLVPKP